jgi:hypothetical protein
LPSCKSDFIMCPSDEKGVQPTQLKFGHAKIATLLPAKVSRRTEKAALHSDRCDALQIDCDFGPDEIEVMKAAYEARLLTWASPTEMIQSPSLLQRQLST